MTKAPAWQNDLVRPLACLSSHFEELTAHARCNSAENRPTGRGLVQLAVRVAAAAGTTLLSASLRSLLTSALRRGRQLRRSTWSTCCMRGFWRDNHSAVTATTDHARRSTRESDGFMRCALAHTHARCLMSETRDSFTACSQSAQESQSRAAQAVASSSTASPGLSGGRPHGCSIFCKQEYFSRPTDSFSASAM